MIFIKYSKYMSSLYFKMFNVYKTSKTCNISDIKNAILDKIQYRIKWCKDQKNIYQEMIVSNIMIVYMLVKSRSFTYTI